jgi:hypothetical protein
MQISYLNLDYRYQCCLFKATKLESLLTRHLRVIFLVNKTLNKIKKNIKQTYYKNNINVCLVKLSYKLAKKLIVEKLID